MKTWKDLKAEGVRRCCGVFVSGKRCRRRAVDGKYWCSRCASVMEPAERAALESLEQHRESSRADDMD